MSRVKCLMLPWRARRRKKTDPTLSSWLSGALLLTFISSCSLVVAHESGHENELLRSLVVQGVKFKEGYAVKLPAPVLVDDLSPERQREIVAEIAGRYSWQQFVRNSPVAPFKLEQHYVKDTQQHRVGHAINLWFIAHGPLEVFRDQRLAEDVLGGQWPGGDPAKAEVHELDETELSPLEMQGVERKVEKYVSVGAPLMSRVYVRGVGHVHRSCTTESVVIAWKLDPRFNQDDRLANRWYPIETTELGERERGAPHAYRGFGGYVKITALAEPEGALFVEAHVAFHEPEEWFRGSNFLRSKTPLMVRESVDKLRRKLTRYARSDTAVP